MKQRKIILNENQLDKLLGEALIKFGDGKNGTITILAGGGGSGKGFILKHIIDTTNAKIFNPDYFKNLIVKNERLIDRFNDEFLENYGYEMRGQTFQDPEFTYDMHSFIKDKGFNEKVKKMFFDNTLLLPPERKPNAIFDITMKDISDLKKIATMALEAGYGKENINIVWVLNSLEQALKFNSLRDRFVPKRILVTAHNKVSETVKEIMSNYSSVADYMDGEMWVVFAGETILTKKMSGNGYIEKVGKTLLKQKGQPPLNIKTMSSTILNKIMTYVPKKDVWKDS